MKGMDADATRRSHDAAREELETLLVETPGGDYAFDTTTLDLLEEIVYHTIAAGHPQEAWDIYKNRIGGYQNLVWRLSDYVRGERICRVFAAGHPPESIPLPEGLRETSQEAFINEWGLYLSGLGSLHAAARCFERHIELRTGVENWRSASRGYMNLADVHLERGYLAVGLQAGVKALDLANRGDGFAERRTSYAYRAHARVLQGKVDDSLNDFHAALEWQHLFEPSFTERPLYGLRGVWQAFLLARVGKTDEAKRLTETNIAITTQLLGRQNNAIPPCILLLAHLARERGDLHEAIVLLRQAHDWSLARDAKELLCWSALVQAMIELAASRQTADGRRQESEKHLQDSLLSIEEGLRIARECGYTIYYIDLLTLRASLRLLKGDAVGAEEDTRIALEKGVHPHAESGLPTLLAATDPECGYAWGEGDARHMLAESLLLRAAQQLGRGDFVPARHAQLPKEVQQLIEAAHEQLNLCCDLRERIQDPKVKDTQRVLNGLKGGALTAYPLEAREAQQCETRTGGIRMMTRKTVVELDLVGYSTIAEMLEQGMHVGTVAELNDRIQDLVDHGLKAVDASREETVMHTTGDGAILVFEAPATAHSFAAAVQAASADHNKTKDQPIGKRVFRMGAATGEIVMEPKGGGGYDIAGMTIARAVRLEAKANPGELLIDEATFQQLPTALQVYYGAIEKVAGKRDEQFEVRRCMLNARAAADAAFFIGEARKAAALAPPIPVGRDKRRQILELFKRLKSYQYTDLVFGLGIPISRQPPDTLDLEEKRSRILKWADEEGKLDDLLDELRYLVGSP